MAKADEVARSAGRVAGRAWVADNTPLSYGHGFILDDRLVHVIVDAAVDALAARLAAAEAELEQYRNLATNGNSGPQPVARGPIVGYITVTQADLEQP